MITCTRRLEFDAGHRIVGHESKCRHLHGHRYVVEVTCRLEEGTDDLGRVIDFGVVKQVIGGWINEWIDHGLLLWRDDPLLPVLEELRVDEEDEHQKTFLMEKNPTAENIAELLLGIAQAALPGEVVPTRVRVWETPNCYADATP